MTDISDTLKQIISQEQPITQKFKPLVDGKSFLEIMRTIDKRRRQMEKDFNRKESLKSHAAKSM